MKNIILILFIFVSIHTFAQNPFNNPTVQVNGQIYDCDNTSGKFIRVVNRQNQISNHWQIESNKLTRVRFSAGGQNMQDIIKNSFSSLRYGQLKVSDKFFSVFYYFNLDGTIKEVWFRIKSNTQITPVELEKLERNLKQAQINVYNQNIPAVLYYTFSCVFEF